MNAIVEEFSTIRVHQSIAINELANAATSIGCELRADGLGLKIVKREIKKRLPRKKSYQSSGLQNVAFVGPENDGRN